MIKGSWMLLVLIIQMAISGVLGFFLYFQSEVGFIPDRVGFFMMIVAFLGFLVFIGIMRFQDVYRDAVIINKNHEALFPSKELPVKNYDELYYKIDSFIDRWSEHFNVHIPSMAACWLKKSILAYVARGLDK